MATVKVTKTLTQSGLGTFVVVSGHPAQGMQTEVIDVTDMSVTNRMLKAPRPQLEGAELTLLCNYAGTLITVGDESTELVITVTDSAGTVVSDTITGFVRSANPQPVEVGGERRLLQEVVFVPDGSEGAVTTAPPATTTTTT